MKSFAEVKELIIDLYTNGTFYQVFSKEPLERLKAHESWEEIKEYVANKVKWCIYQNIQLPDDHYKTSKCEFNIVNGKLEGEYKEWYENGQPFERSFYKNGELHGEYRKWFDNGQLTQHSFYKEGKEIVKDKLKKGTIIAKVTIVGVDATISSDGDESVEVYTLKIDNLSIDHNSPFFDLFKNESISDFENRYGAIKNIKIDIEKD
jgi:hypothetical protein